MNQTELTSPNWTTYIRTKYLVKLINSNWTVDGLCQSLGFGKKDNSMTCDKKLINEVKHMRPKICVPTLHSFTHSYQQHSSIRELFRYIRINVANLCVGCLHVCIQIWGKRNAPYNQANCIPLRSWEYNATRNILYTSDIYDTPKPVY